MNQARAVSPDLMLPRILHITSVDDLPPLIRTSDEGDEASWYERVCVEQPAFRLRWHTDTLMVRHMLNIGALVGIDKSRVRPTVRQKGQIVARCCDPDQADVAWSLIKRAYGTKRVSPFSNTSGGCRVYPRSIFNQGEDEQQAGPWIKGFSRIIDGKEMGDILELTHVPCLGGHHENVPIEYLIWELKMGKRTLLGRVPGFEQYRIPSLESRAIDLAVQVDFEDTREQGIYLVNERVARDFLDLLIREGMLDIPEHVRPSGWPQWHD